MTVVEKELVSPVQTEADNKLKIVRAIRKQLKNRYDDLFKDILKRVNRGEISGYSPADPYPHALQELQKAEDKEFRELLPDEFNKIESEIGPANERLSQAVTITQEIIEVLKQNNIDPRFVIICRAKSDLSIWEKMKRNGIDRDEVFDIIGVRIVIASDESDERQMEHVRTIKNALLHSNRFQLMEPHQYPPRPEYKGKTPIHDPIRDTLREPGGSGYRRVRMNLERIDEKSDQDKKKKLPIEVQITTAKFLKDLNEDSNIYYFLGKN